MIKEDAEKGSFMTSAVKVMSVGSEKSTVAKLFVKEGAHVKAGQKLGVIQAKKKNYFYSPNYGEVKKVNVTVGQEISSDDVLVEIDSYDGGSWLGKIKRIARWLANVIVCLGLCILFLLLIVFLCQTPQKAYWGKDQSPGNGQVATNDNGSRVVGIPSEDSGLYQNLGIVEFDEYGDLWDLQQLVNIKSLIAKNSKDNQPVIVFIHGWNNNSSPDNGDLQRFSEFNQGLEGFEPVGIYIGWRGKSVSGPLHYATFSERRVATDRVASIALTRCLWEIRQTARANNKNRKVILIGHSFGGRILEQVASSSVLNYYNFVLKAQELESDRRKHLIGDLILLINPASESLNAKQLKLAMREWPYAEPPGIISLTADTDSATGRIWSLGKRVERFSSPYIPLNNRDYNINLANQPIEGQSTYLDRTSGHDLRILSGYLGLEKEAQPANANGARRVAFNKHIVSIEDSAKRGLDYEQFERPAAKDRYAGPKMFHTHPLGGYWAFAIDKHTLLGHNGAKVGGRETIFGKEVNTLCRQIINEFDQQAYEQNIKNSDSWLSRVIETDWSSLKGNWGDQD